MESYSCNTIIWVSVYEQHGDEGLEMGWGFGVEGSINICRCNESNARASISTCQRT